MSLKFADEDHLHHITKCSVVIVVPLACRLIVGVTMLVKEAVGGGVEGGQNLLDISNFPTFCMLLISQQCLFNKQQ